MLFTFQQKNKSWSFLLSVLVSIEFIQSFQLQHSNVYQIGSRASTDMATMMTMTGTDNNGSDTGAGTGTGTGTGTEDEAVAKKRKRDKVMSFLRNVGAVGKNQDFSTAMGVDEGPVGKNKSAVRKLEKVKSAFQWCSETGVIDDMSQPFPTTSSGSEWKGFTDQVMGGVSQGICTREVIEGRTCNLMKGKVSLYNNGGFIQMATSLTTDPALSLTVDVSDYDGVELDVLYKGEEDVENFNVHLRNTACLRQFSSYRSTFTVGNDQSWQTVKLPFSDFVGYGPGSSETPFDASDLKRLGIVAIGKKMEVFIAVSGVRFYKD